jgi:ABC-type sugar transport system ATPase subunit
MDRPIVTLRGISKTFGEVSALTGASLELFSGEVLGLVGPNGSGKTTLTSVLCGSVLPDAGEIFVGDANVSFSSPADVISYGIRKLPQSLEVYPALNVLENIFVGQEIAFGLAPFRVMKWKEMEQRARFLLEQVGTEGISPRSLISRLSGGQQKSVMLARLMATQASVLVFDEPDASLGVTQKVRLLELLRAEAKLGRSIILISHDVDDVLAACDRVVVIRRGVTVKSEFVSEIDQDILSKEMAVA